MKYIRLSRKIENGRNVIHDLSCPKTLDEANGFGTIIESFYIFL